MPTREACERLVETSIDLLHQAESLLEEMEAALYAASPPAIAPHSAGGHLRHILEFYECFLDGFTAGVVDYDARKRNREVETERGAALAAQWTREVITEETREYLLSLKPQGSSEGVGLFHASPPEYWYAS